MSNITVGDLIMNEPSMNALKKNVIRSNDNRLILKSSNNIRIETRYKINGRQVIFLLFVLKDNIVIEAYSIYSFSELVDVLGNLI